MTSRITIAFESDGIYMHSDGYWSARSLWWINELRLNAARLPTRCMRITQAKAGRQYGRLALRELWR